MHAENDKLEQQRKRHLVQEEVDVKRIRSSLQSHSQLVNIKTSAQMAGSETVQCQSTMLRPSVSNEVERLLKDCSYEYDSEYFSKSFTQDGGELRHWTTDDYLEIPTGAVPDGQEWEIQDKIHTSLDKFDNVFLKGERKQFRSCVLEYGIKNGPLHNNDRQFLKRVVINIRHSVTDRLTANKLRVFCLEDDDQVIEIFQHTNSSGRNPWFELHDDFLRIHTYHFCKYTCVCTDTENKVKDIQYFTATLYGKITRIFNENAKYEADLSFALWAQTKDGVGNLPEFREVIAFCMTTYFVI